MKQKYLYLLVWVVGLTMLSTIFGGAAVALTMLMPKSTWYLIPTLILSSWAIVGTLGLMGKLLEKFG